MPIQNDTISTKLISVGFAHIYDFAEGIWKSTFVEMQGQTKNTVSM